MSISLYYAKLEIKVYKIRIKHTKTEPFFQPKNINISPTLWH